MGSRRFSVWVARLSAGACATAALPTAALLDDLAGGVGLLFGAIWMGCLAVLLADRDRSPAAGSTDAGDGRDPADAGESADRSGAMLPLLGSATASPSDRTPARGSRRNILLTVMTAAMVAQLVAFHYSTRVDF